MKVLRLSFASVLLALCALPTGCTTDTDTDTNDPMESIASLTLTNGNRLEFYEPSPGLVLVSEAGIVGAVPTPHDGRTPVELYRDLAPDRPIPDALVAAQARSEALRPEAAPATAEDRSPAVTTASVAEPTTLGFIDNQSCDDHWFSDNFCNASPDWQMCLLNHWNGAFAQLSSVDFVQHAVCADIGAVTLKVQMGDGTGIIRDVLEGHWLSWSWADNCTFGCNTSTRGDILNASNNRFHYAVNAWF